MMIGALALGSPEALAAQGSADAIDPVGTYDFIATLGIAMRTGTLEIRLDADGALVGEARLQGESDPAVIDDVVVSGNRVRILAYVNARLPVTIELDFAGPDAFTGTIAVPDDSIVIDGTRRKP